MSQGLFAVLVDVSGPEDGRLEKHLQRYFNIRRKSAGGDCGVQQLNKNTFIVTFQEGEAQQRVLQREGHGITLDSTEYKLTVRTLKDGEGISEESSQSQEASGTSGSLSGDRTFRQGPIPNGRQLPKNPGGSEDGEWSMDVGEMGIRIRMAPSFGECLNEREDVLRELQQELLGARCQMRLVPGSGSILLLPASGHIPGGDSAVWAEGAVRALRRFQERHKELQPETGQNMAPVPGPDGALARLGKDVDHRAAEEDAPFKLDSLSKFSFIRDSFRADLASRFPGLTWALVEGGPSVVFSGSPADRREARSCLRQLLGSVLERTVRLSDAKRRFLASWAPGALAGELFSFPVALEMAAGGHLALLGNSWPDLDRAKSILDNRIAEEEVLVPGEASDWVEALRPFPSEASHRLQVVEGQGAGGEASSVCLVGFEEEVGRAAAALREHVRQRAPTEETLLVERPALVPFVHGLLDLMDCRGLRSTVRARGREAIVLTGPRSVVGDERRRVESCLAAVVWERLALDEPGARDFFRGRGKEQLEAVGREAKCLVALEEEEEVEEEEAASPGSVVLSSYRAAGGLTVTVCRGDITQQRVDAIVNAANGRLVHGGGVAEAILRAGGPQIGRESLALVAAQGPVEVGKAAMTNGGRLPCAKVIHAVGPDWGMKAERGTSGVRELLESAVTASLELAARAGLRSIAFPCLSAGIFGIPKDLCADAIVSAIRGFGTRCPRRVALVDINDGVLRELQRACGQAWPSSGPSVQSPTIQAPPATGLQLEIKSGLIENQQSDVLVIPISCDMNIYSSAISKAIFDKSPNLQSSLRQCTILRPKMVSELDVRLEARLKCKSLYFLLDDAFSRFESQSQETFGLKIRACLELCTKALFSSITFPLFGHSKEATTRTLLREIQRFKDIPTSIKKVQISIAPFDKSGEAILRKAQQELESGQTVPRSLGNESGASYHSWSFGGTSIRVKLGNITLQVSNGDITMERVDAIVNSTGYHPPKSGVSHAISKAAKMDFHGMLKTVDMSNGIVVCTKGGKLNCKAIMHVSGDDNLAVIRQAVQNVLQECYKRQYESVAFPAIGTGNGKLSPHLVAGVMFDTIASVAKNFPTSIQLIRIVITNSSIYQTFAKTLETIVREVPPSSAQSDTTRQSGAAEEISGRDESEQEVFRTTINVFGRDQASVKEALRGLERVREENFSEASHVFPSATLLTAGEVDGILQLGRQHGVRVVLERGKVRARGERVSVKSALTSAVHLLEGAMQREWDQMYSKVRWCYTVDGKELPFEPAVSFELEQCHTKNECETVLQIRGNTLIVNLLSNEATVSETKQLLKIRRVEHFGSK
ncbi:protein mono-ADP-ribosyltransferase PARP14-like [Mustelus asterias]